MAVVADFKASSLFGKLALVLLLLASICIGIALTCPGWGEGGKLLDGFNYHWSLWRICLDADHVEGCQMLDGTPNSWWGFTQAGVIIGFIGIILSFIMICLYTFFGSCKKNGELAMAAGIICIITGVLLLIACIVFGVKWDKVYVDAYNSITGVRIQHYWLSYAYGFAIVACILEIVSGVLCIIDAKKGGGTAASG